MPKYNALYSCEELLHGHHCLRMFVHLQCRMHQIGDNSQFSAAIYRSTASDCSCSYRLLRRQTMNTASPTRELRHLSASSRSIDAAATSFITPPFANTPGYTRLEQILGVIAQLSSPLPNTDTLIIQQRAEIEELEFQAGVMKEIIFVGGHKRGIDRSQF